MKDRRDHFNKEEDKIMFNNSGKSIPSFIGVIASAILLVVLFAGFIFFTFTNTGVGIVQKVNNALKGDPPIPSKNEIVMPPNATITATTNSGTIVIKSGNGLRRYYTWEGVTRSVVMIPRGYRNMGSYGIYNPGSGFNWLPAHNGIRRGVVQEGQQHFDTQEEAEAWLKSLWGDYVYNDTGLVVCFSKMLDRASLNVDVWQIYVGGNIVSDVQEPSYIRRGVKSNIYHIGGKKPTKLEGSKNSAIITSWDNSLTK